MDFTIEKYRDLMRSLHNGGNVGNIVLRHDVDARPIYALRIAQIEKDEGMSSTFYFRTMHFDSHADIIHAIAQLGHHIGYHYESLTTCHGNMAAAYADFCHNLERLRMIEPVTAACAHGSPRSQWNSQDIWLNHDIHALGITHESMLDTDFSHTLYLTDTGRRWDGYRVSIRDKVEARQQQWEQEGLVFHSTNDIISALHNPLHPIHNYSLLINTHPQRWMPFGTRWVTEALMQRAKNLVKRVVATHRH